MANKSMGSAEDFAKGKKGLWVNIHQTMRHRLEPVKLPILLKFGLLGLLLTLLTLFLKTARASESAIIATMYRNYAKDFPEVEAISVAKLQQWQQQDDIILVDVREPEERLVSILPGAISREAFERDRDRYQDKTIVPYCTIGYRSGLYAQDLQVQGFRVFNLAGSILSWTHAGGVLMNAEGMATHQVHVYGSQWNLVAEDYEAIW
ncbi:MAG: rhodanese-like domain-containing protein [Cyanobacteria bacterium P01_A01_bin.123]